MQDLENRVPIAPERIVSPAQSCFDRIYRNASVPSSFAGWVCAFFFPNDKNLKDEDIDLSRYADFSAESDRYRLQ
jgi:hypothetical protein